MVKNTYADKLKDPRWQRRRLEIMGEDNFTCVMCFDTESMLVVHHRCYIKGREPWDYTDNFLMTICYACHNSEHEEPFIEIEMNKVKDITGNGNYGRFVKLFHVQQLETI